MKNVKMLRLLLLSVLALSACDYLQEKKREEQEDISQKQKKSFRFAVIGEYGNNTTSAVDVLNLVKFHKPDFIVTTGGNNFPGGEADTIDMNIGRLYSSYIYPYSGSFVGAAEGPNRFFPALGVNDWTPGNIKAYTDYFSLPGNERYYDFTWGDARFFVLNTNDEETDGNTVTSEQAEWLKKGLKQATQTFKFVVMHHSPDSSDFARDVPVPATKFQWPFKEWGATAVFSGKDRIYERLQINGIPYFVNGLGGCCSAGQIALNPAASSKFRYSTDYGAMIIEIEGKKATFNFYSIIDTKPIDTYEIIK